MEKIKVGLIGFGLSGKILHTPLMQAQGGYEIVKVMSSRRAEVTRVLPGAQVVENIADLIADPAIDLVVNTGPNDCHYPYTAAALAAGKNVVVEKPFVVSVPEGEQLIALAAKVGKCLTVFHNRRWDADFLTVQQLVQGGQLGEIMQFEAHYDRFRPTTRNRWREQSVPGAGILYDLGSHLIDQALVLFGPPQSLLADVAQQKPGGVVHDYFHLIFRYQQMRVILHGSSFTEVTPRYQIFGTKSSYVKYGLDPQEDQLRNGEDPNHIVFGRERPANYGRLTHFTAADKYSEPVPAARGDYLSFYRRLYDAIKKDHCPLPVTADSALMVVRLIEQALASAKTGKEVLLDETPKTPGRPLQSERAPGPVRIPPSI